MALVAVTGRSSLRPLRKGKTEREQARVFGVVCRSVTHVARDAGPIVFRLPFRDCRRPWSLGGAL